MREYMREYEERREIEKFYETAKKNIKEKIETKGVSCKGGAKGQAITEIMSVFDDEMEIGIAEEMVTARQMLRQYCDKYREIESLERKFYENKKKIEEQEAVKSLVDCLTDEVLRNAILAYNAIRNSDNAKEIAIAYIKSKGREDLQDVIDESEGE